MWIFTKLGFFSLTQSRTCPGEMHFRARVRKDLENLKERFGMEEEIIETPQADYRWRIMVTQVTACELMDAMTEDIDYSNFKSAVHKEPTQSNKSGPYMEIWRVMKGVQDREGTGRRIAFVQETALPVERQCKHCHHGEGDHRASDNRCAEKYGRDPWDANEWHASNHFEAQSAKPLPKARKNARKP